MVVQDEGCISMAHRWFQVRALLPVAAIALLMTLVSAAGVSAADGQARVRIVHASPDAPNVDVWVNGNVAVSDLAFKQATDYLTLPAGDYKVQVTPAGGAASDAVIDATLTLKADTDYTVAAVGKVADIQPLVLVDDNTAPAAGKAHLRVVHASPDAPAVDVAVADGPTLIQNLAFPTASDYLPVDAGTYNLEVRPTGTDTSALDVNGFVANAGTVYTVFAVGQVGDGSLSVLPLVDSTNMAATTAPSMPATGAGGTAASTTSSTNWMLAIGGAAVLLMAGSGMALARKRVSR
jgi:hypothetical protein